MIIHRPTLRETRALTAGACHRRLGGAGIRRGLRGPRGGGGGGAAPYDPLTAHTWRVFCLFDEANLVHVANAVSDATNQGTGADFQQLTAGAKPTFSADHYGAGLDAVTLGAGDWLESVSDIDYGGATGLSLVWAGTITNVATYHVAIGINAGAQYMFHGTRITTGVVRPTHDLDGIATLRVGTTNRLNVATYTVSRHDLTQAGGSEISVTVNGLAEDGGTEGFNGNNTTGLGLATTRIGIWHDEVSFPFVGSLRFVGITPDDVGASSQFQVWLASQVGL